MSSDGDNRPLPPKRQRHRQINVPDSSEESDSSVHRNPRRRNTSKRTNGSEDAGTSCLDERANGISDKSPNSAIPSTNIEGAELKHRSTASKFKKVSEKVTEETATSSKNVVELNVSETQDEQCPICLIAFVNQEVASPSSCEHFFCFACLMEWSKSTNTCPVDRKTFNVMDVRPKFGEKVERRIPVTVNTNGNGDETDSGDMDYSDDDLEFGRRIVDSMTRTALPNVVFPRTLFSPNSSYAISSSENSSASFETLNHPDTSTELFDYSLNRENHLSSPSLSSALSSSEPSENNQASSPIECDEPSSPIVIVVSSDNEEISDSSSSSDNREASSPPDNEQFSSPDRNEQFSSPDHNEQFSSESDNHKNSSPPDNQRSSSPSGDQHYSSVDDSPIIEEEPSSPSVKTEPLSASEGEEQSSDIERYSYSSDKEESPPQTPSEDESILITDYDSEPFGSSSSSY